MKVLIHGAINQSNFGDFIFAELFSNVLKENGIDVEYYSHPKYGISDFFAKNLGYVPDRRHYKKTMKECDALVYISGGYFVSHKKVLIELRHTWRFLMPAKYFLKSRKPIYLLGIGAGPFYKGPFGRIAKELLEYASAVTLRNEESKDYCSQLGVERDIPVTADSALVIKEFMRDKKADVPAFDIKPGKKMLLFHIDAKRDMRSKLSNVVVPAIKKFLDVHKEYELFLASDGLKRSCVYEEYERLFENYSPHVLKYNDPWKLTRHIERADLILTTKLHVGIVGTVFGCSVVSFPWDQKTVRYYKQIGESDRCIPLKNADEIIVLSQMERFEGKHVSLPEELIKKARINFEMLPRYS